MVREYSPPESSDTRHEHLDDEDEELAFTVFWMSLIFRSSFSNRSLIAVSDNSVFACCRSRKRTVVSIDGPDDGECGEEEDMTGATVASRVAGREEVDGSSAGSACPGHGEDGRGLSV